MEGLGFRWGFGMGGCWGLGFGVCPGLGVEILWFWVLGFWSGGLIFRFEGFGLVDGLGSECGL